MRIGMGLFLALVLAAFWLGQGRAQTPVEPPLRLLLAHAPADAAPFVPGVVLVRLSGGEARTGDAARRLGVEESALTPLAIPGQAGLYRLNVGAGDEQAVAARLAARPDVLYAEPDFLFFMAETTPNDSLYDRYQWNLRHIRANTGWDRTTGSNSVVIAIVDTGVDLGHPDLAAKIVPGIDKVNNDSDPQDDEGHGTHVASIAAALGNNSAGIAGVDWNARIMPVKVLDAAGSGSSGAVAAGIVWAADNGADVVNLSLSGTNPSTVILNAVQYAHAKGVLLIAAAGNSYNNGNPTSYPAAYPNVLGVAAVNDTDGHASYSNSGSYVDVAAPGGDPTDSNDTDPRHWIPGAYWRGAGASYAWLSGTSQAAPHVAGLAALLLALDPSLTPDQLSQIITSSALDVQSPGWDAFSGYGRIDVAAALAAILPPATATPTISPTPSPTFTASPTPTPSATPTPTPAARSREDVRINSSAANAQSYPALAIDGADNLTAIWRDRRNGADALYSAGLSANAIQWDANLFLTGTQQISATDQIGLPGLAAAGDGAFVAAWHDYQVGDRASTIFVGRMQKGQADWSGPEQVDGDSTPAASQKNPTIALAADGTLVAVWEDFRPQARASVTDLYWSQSSASQSGWSGALPVALSADAERSPRLAIAGNRVYAVWVEQGAEGARILFSQRDLTSSVWALPAVLVPAVSDGTLAAPDIAADSSGNMLAVWQEYRGATTGAKIYSSWRLADAGWSVPQRVDSDDHSAAWQSAPRLATNGREVALVWQDERNGDGDIYVVWAVWPQGDWSPEQRVNQDAGAAEQFAPAVAMDSWGHTTVVWSDERIAASAPDIYSRFIPAGERFRFFLPLLQKP